MDEKQKLNIIQNLIEKRFNKDSFSEFISNVLNVTVRNRKESTAVWTEYKKYIESYQIFGDYEDSNNQRIYIIAVKVKDNVDPTRAKVKQREIIAKMLREYKKDGALVAFYSDSNPVWRMAFVKLEYSFTAKGLEEKLTPAKRLSYIVGEDEASHTVKKQFMTLIKLSTEVTLGNLEELFQLEKVTNEFFDEYKKKYLDLKECLESNETFMEEARKQNFENPENFSEGFAKKLMGQLAFLYFLQKKGWLGVTIVPKELTNDEYNNILNRALPEEKDLLINTYNQKGSTFKLSSEVMNYSIQDADKLANCFKNHPVFDGFWGTGDKKFIRKLFRRHLEIKESTGKDRAFFDDYLEELFYEALNLDRGSNQYFKKFNCKIPFLNGGLFEPYDNYDWKNTEFKVPDTLFSNDNNDGILDIFDRYNFTISENEPYETEVAVDPEMLGKVFENLLDVSDRKSKGAFYTPREIVHYMCKESLINYLLNEIEGVNREEVEYLIQLGEFTREYDEHLFEKDYMDYLKGDASEFSNSWGMPETIRKNAHKIDEIIKSVRVADPAIGSGAFPLGMLNEIVKVRNILTQYILFEDALQKDRLDVDIYRTLRNRLYNNRSLYKLKIETIENSLYGVDIEPSAVDIAKLRLWLSIVVDTRDNDIRPLPNLDFNFMVGNSLIDEFDGVSLFDEKLLTKRLKETYTETKNNAFNSPVAYQKDLFGGIESLKIDIMLDLDKYHKAFFKERNTDRKKELKNEIEKLEWLLITETLTASGNASKIKELEKLKQQKRKPYFLWKLEFAKVFQEKGGFDIVIGNPPYLRIQGIKEFNPELAEAYKNKYQSATGSYDLYVLFTERALQLVKSKGVVNFIMPHKWTNASFGKGLREIISLGNHMKKFISFGAYQVFNASTYTSLIWLEKNENKSMKYYEFNRDFADNNILGSSLNQLTSNDYVQMENQDLKPLEVIKGNKISYKDKLWNFMPKDNQKIINRIKMHSKKVEDIFSQVFTGLQTSKDTVYFLHNCKEISDNLIEGYSQELEEVITIEKGIVKPLLKGDMVHRYDTLATDK
ncbi:Eco57I restriction-modification methylase domain-containing protein, partial [Cetobacterium sp.]|uniref:Eco57I restriction-modification methylase domain-containing protein n=1 Tax=Cetobacterium sp. TaxID=2071632 RepID=UPI003F3FBE6B